MRSVEELHESGLAVIERAYIGGAYRNAPLFSGGHDSLCAVHLASQHRSFQHVVHHIDTGIGSKYTRSFVERVCNSMNWQLVIHRSPVSYEWCVATHGFPGPGGHKFIYNLLKDRCIYQITKGSRAYVNATLLINGSRSEESVRRMGHVSAIQVGELIKKGKLAGRKRNLNRVWAAPCHDWSRAEQAAYMDEWGLPVNKLKVTLGLSGECFCGAFASPGEREMVKQFAPDVDTEICRLTDIAKANGKPCNWGQRPPGKVAVVQTGPMCSGCDLRAAMNGIKIVT